MNAELYALGFTHTLASRVAAKIRIASTGCHEWQAARLPSGYGRVGRGQRNRGVELAHRAVWMLRHGAIPAGMVIRHTCDNPPCCNIDHLEIGTSLDNSRDMRECGRANYARGERHSFARLTDADVDDLRSLRATAGKTYAELGRTFGISHQHARAICLRIKRAS